MYIAHTKGHSIIYIHGCVHGPLLTKVVSKLTINTHLSVQLIMMKRTVVSGSFLAGEISGVICKVNRVDRKSTTCHTFISL